MSFDNKMRQASPAHTLSYGEVTTLFLSPLRLDECVEVARMVAAGMEFETALASFH